MLRPVVRSFTRTDRVRCRHRHILRRIHASTAIRSNNDPKDPASENSTLSETTSSSTDNSTSIKDNAQSIPSAEVPVGQDVTGANGASASKSNASTSFEARRREREAKLEKDKKHYKLPTDSLEERNRKFRRTQYDLQQSNNDEASKRGAEVFEMVNRARAARGEEPIGIVKENGREQRTDERPIPPYREGREGRNWEGREGRHWEGREGRHRSNERSSRRGDRRGRGPRERDKRRTEVQDRLDRRIAQIRERRVRTHHYSPTFNPSQSMHQGFDEVDFELAYDLPDPIPIKDNFNIANRDGTVREERKTNRDYDELPEDASSFIDMRDLGPIGPTFYTPELPPMETEEEIIDRVQSTNYSEKNEDDVNELMQIKEEIEEGKGPAERQEARRDREISKALALQDEQYTQGVNHGTWGQLVPLPKPHRPETADVDKYEAPHFTHDSFRYGIPPLPYGSRGRLEAAKSAAVDLTDPLIPPAFDVLDSLPENEEQSQDLDSAIKDLTDLIETMEVNDDDEPLAPFRKNVKQPLLRQTRGRLTETWDDDHEFQIEDIYSDDQLAIWKEMHADSFAPEDVKFPVYENEEEVITLQQQEREGNERVEVFKVMDQLSAATLKNFRRRDEFEIRDIRRRLGLPIVNDTVMEEAYVNKTKVDVPSTIDSKTIHQGEIADRPTPVVDDTKVRLRFWRDIKSYVAKLTSRINYLRSITQETYDRLRRHGTAELRLKPGSTPSSTEVIENPEDGIMARLHKQFIDVHKKLETLEILATAMQLGPGGPLDPEYSAAWVEANLHKHEAEEFEQTARKMGYPANSISMDPVPTAEEKADLETVTGDWYERVSRLAVGGEYRGAGSYPGEGLVHPMGLAGRYAARSGLDEFQKGQRVWMMARTFDNMNIPLEDPLDQGDEQVEEEEGEDEQGARAHALQKPTPVEPGDRISPHFTSIMNRLRQSMSEIDKDMGSLENTYDEFLKENPPPSPISTTSPPPTQEASP